MLVDTLDDRGAERGLIAQVADAVEAEVDVLVASVEDRVMARVQLPSFEPSAPLREALRRGVAAVVRDALARLRSQAKLPQELLPDLIGSPASARARVASWLGSWTHGWLARRCFGIASRS